MINYFFLAAIDTESLLDGVYIFVVVSLGAFVVLAIVTSIVRFHQLTTVGEVEGVGSPRDVFMLRIARKMVAVHRQPRPFGLILARSLNRGGQSDGSPAKLPALEERLRTVVRSGDVVQAFDRERAGIIIETDIENLSEIVERIHRRLLLPPGSGGAGLAPEDVRLACAAFPVDGQSMEALMEKAEESLDKAVNIGKRGAFVLAFDSRLHDEDGNQSFDDAKDEEESVPSFIDPVTGVLKADRATKGIQKYVARRKGNNRPATLILIRIDGIEQMRTLHGNDGVDEAMKTFSELLQDNLREDDLISLWGEDGFACCIDGTDQQGMHVVKRLISGMRKATFRHQGRPMHLAAFWGLASYPEHARLPWQIISFAELALNAAQDRGRNTCVGYNPSMIVKRKVSTVESESF